MKPNNENIQDMHATHDKIHSPRGAIFHPDLAAKRAETATANAIMRVTFSPAELFPSPCPAVFSHCGGFSSRSARTGSKSVLVRTCPDRGTPRACGWSFSCFLAVSSRIASLKASHLRTGSAPGPMDPPALSRRESGLEKLALFRRPSRSRSDSLK